MADTFFLKLFEVVVKHDYYTSGLSSDFTFRPSNECKSALKRFGLLFKPIANGFAVLYGARISGPLKVPVKPIDNNERFTFIMSLKNQYLLNFSELPLDNAENEIFYFDNITNNKSSTGELLVVDDTTNKYTGANDVITIGANIYTYIENTINPFAVAKILDKFDNELISKTFNNAGGKITCQFDISRLEPAVYKFWYDGTVKQTFYKDNRLLFERIFGIIDIFKNNSVPADYRFADAGGNVSFKQYVLQFHRRSTIWKYFVIKKYKRLAPALGLQVGANPVITGTPHILPDGTDSTLFDFSTPSEMKEKPVENIKLISNGTVLIQNLPNPATDIIKPDVNDLNKVYSEVYIYI